MPDKLVKRTELLVTNHVFLYEGKPIKGIKRGGMRAKMEGFRFHDLRHCTAIHLRRIYQTCQSVSTRCFRKPLKYLVAVEGLEPPARGL